MPDSIERREVIQSGPALAFAALLDVPAPDLAAGEGLPLTWHWLYLLDWPRQADLGSDGHPVRGTLPEPPGPGFRRMWAGGQIRRRGELRVGREATRRSAVVGSEEKQGRSGRFTVVTVAHEISQNGAVVVEERQDIVYRAAVVEPQLTPPVEAVGAPVPLGTGEWEIPVTTTLLFRFSALTQNAHRIHYDRDYARQAEGYPALVTHGPLQAMAMAEAARRRHRDTGPGVTFDYRLVSPLLEHQGLVAGAAGAGVLVETSVRDRSGRRTARGSVGRA